MLRESVICSKTPPQISALDLKSYLILSYDLFNKKLQTVVTLTVHSFDVIILNQLIGP